MPQPLKLGAGMTDPRVIMRVIIGLLLIANLAAAVIAFKPFGGSADDLTRERERLSSQVNDLQKRVADSKKLVDKVEKGRTEGDQFLDKYFSDIKTASTVILQELNDTATQAGIKMGQWQFDRQPVEGSDTLQRETITVGFDGTYPNFTKFINLVDKSPRFLIIESMQAAAPQAQNGQSLNVTLKIIRYIKETPGGAI
ncbi:MAG TPA: type 4a pilus biogenesis protein PilO [Bryobacteraceae bacterium]|nr:type 4a pilus biogenesis protein PilO [Anaeromyxobacteraceae bacterium]HTS24680.1 type 4a pilus biogenesis protein PilO [Bryobacteraceae bacterium]